MMGAAIAYVCAKAGIEVVLKDVSLEAAQRGKGYSAKLVAKAVERGRSTQEEGDELLARITPADRPGGRRGRRPRDRGGVRGSEGQGAGVQRDRAAPGARTRCWAPTPRRLPITGLAEDVVRPADFIGVHFFSPVDKMPLVELIRGEKTADETVHRALDFVKQIKKTPIVVNDSRGFFTSRVIGTFINEGISMLAEGVPAPSIEQASSQAGYPAPVLQLSDELNMKLMRKIRDAAREAAEAAGAAGTRIRLDAVIDRMLDEFDRPGRLEGRGFYEYEDGKRVGLWKGLRDAFPPVGTARPVAEGPRGADAVHRGARVGPVPRRGRDRVRRRRQHRVDHGDRLPGLDRRRAAVHQRIRRRTIAGFVARARELAAHYGERFEPPASLVERAERGEVLQRRAGIGRRLTRRFFTRAGQTGLREAGR